MPYSQLVALGSSFAAGPGLAPVVDRAAGRSAQNYAHLVAAHLGATLVDATVSGATTTTLVEKPQRVLLRTFPPQVGSVQAGADLVTVTAGGNDLGYLGGVVSAALLGRLRSGRLSRALTNRLRPRGPLRAVTSEQRRAAAEGLVRVVDGIRLRAPQARVVLVDYLPLFTESSRTSRTLPLSTEEMEHFRGVAAELSAAYAEASRRTGADLVPASAYPPDHGAGSRVPWVNSLRWGRSLGSSFHPNLAGMRAVADAVVDHLQGDHPA